MKIKERILEGAHELFMRFGIKSVTMNDIANHLAVSKKTIYQNFTDKNELVEIVLEVQLQKEKQEMDRLKVESTDAIDEMVKVTIHSKEKLDRMNPSVIYDLKKYYPKAYKYLQNHKEECYTHSLLENFKKGQEQEYYRKNLNPQILAILRVEQFELAFDPSIYPITKFNPAEVELEMLQHFIYGIVTPKGLELLTEYMSKNEIFK